MTSQEAFKTTFTALQESHEPIQSIYYPDGVFFEFADPQDPQKTFTYHSYPSYIPGLEQGRKTSLSLDVKDPLGKWKGNYSIMEAMLFHEDEGDNVDHMSVILETIEGMVVQYSTDENGKLRRTGFTGGTQNPKEARVLARHGVVRFASLPEYIDVETTVKGFIEQVQNFDYRTPQLISRDIPTEAPTPKETPQEQPPQGPSAYETFPLMSETLKRLRDEKQLSTADLADNIGVPYKLLKQVEEGEVNPNLDLLSVIAGELGIGVIELLEQSKPDEAASS